MSNPTQQKGKIAHELNRLLKIIAILCGLGFCVFVVLPAMFVGGLHWKSEITISNMQQDEVNWVIDHAYPNSTMVRAEGNVIPWPAGNTITVNVLVTFESTDSFDTVKGWYVQHPDGGWGGGTEGGNLFPQYGLEKVDGSASDKTRYHVGYLRVMSCEDFLGCDRSLQQIR